MTAPAEERVVVADRHPATVLGPDGTTYDGARVVLTRESMFVFVVHAGVVEMLVVQDYDAEQSVLGRRGWTVAADDGAWTVERGSGCGCSSPLKRFVPWTPWRVGRL